MISKLVFQDGNAQKVLRGTVIQQDDYCIEFLTTHGQKFTIGKKALILLKEEGDEQQ